jgi:hypothetical protein
LVSSFPQERISPDISSVSKCLSGERIADMFEELEKPPLKIALSQRIFRYFENGLMQVVLGIVGGLAGSFVDGRWFVLLMPLAVAALHRGKVLEGLSRPFRIVIYVLATCAISVVFFRGGMKLNASRDEEYAALIRVIRAIPSTSVSTAQVFWQPKPSPSGSPAPTQTTDAALGQDELLAGAKMEINNCKAFLIRSDRRENGGSNIGINIEEEKYNMRRDWNMDHNDPSPNTRPGHAEEMRARHQASINKLEQTFSDREVQLWNNTDGPTFEPIYHRMMEEVSSPPDIDALDPVGNPKSLDDIKGQCIHLGDLIGRYESKPQ